MAMTDDRHKQRDQRRQMRPDRTRGDQEEQRHHRDRRGNG
jgi:hypothetical protein